jgi:plasmid maintenance system antidote protein VapI
MEINERIKQIRAHFCDGSNNKFAEMLGITPQNASTLVREGKSIGKRLRTRILETFPVSEMWLLKDEGKMQKDDTPAESASTESVPAVSTPAESAPAESAPAENTEDNTPESAPKDHTPENAPEDRLCMDSPQRADVPVCFLLTVIDRQSQAILELNKTVAAQQQIIDNLLSKRI